MNHFPSSKTVERLRAFYPAGTRVALEYMDDPYTTLRPGDEGTVIAIDDAGTIHIQWDNGSTLGAAYDADKIRKV